MLRRSLTLAAVGLSAITLSGCEKPYPGVTVWSGTKSEHSAALCWQRDAASALGAKDCAENLLTDAQAGKNVAHITVAPGNTVGVSVDTVVASSGWSLKIAGQDLATNLHETYFRFTFPEQGASSPEGYSLQITANGVGGAPRGVWFFQMVPREV